MENVNVWKSPENFSLVFRCTTVEYADSFVDLGEIKFNTPKSWQDYAKEYGDGRGDEFEGTMATCKINDITKLAELINKYKKYKDLETYMVKDRCCLKRKKDMHLPCFCFYILKHNMFECPGEDGVHKLTTKIPASYFRDFTDDMEFSKVDELEERKRPAVVCIKDYIEFEKRLLIALLSLGVKRDEIIIGRINYIDYEKYGENSWWDFGQTPPKQLLIKPKHFKQQNEARIIINTKNNEIKKILDKPIKIGPLNDIANVIKKYFYNGMKIEMNSNIEQV
ncbi:hypothetical protein JYG23_04235 [Sedimentibacter sp. zth1]|uniref:hypothetical protein n=1 Tax=Sedimentibacter sp. zth1 TaxID=2816908 RepID=UPI001A9353AA|nr:hypothetical protein [Sedimentibacter sp. zth1]QSX06670.1 hypothetical protein JYG23_04235 [Sedimentibacter sp. zth1]